MTNDNVMILALQQLAQSVGSAYKTRHPKQSGREGQHRHHRSLNFGYLKGLNRLAVTIMQLQILFW